MLFSKVFRMLFVFTLLVASLTGFQVFDVPPKVYAAESQSPHTPIASDDSNYFSDVNPPKDAIIKEKNGLLSPGFSGSGTPGGQKLQTPKTSQIKHIDSPIDTSDIIGVDDRLRVSDTTLYPYRAIVHIQSSLGTCSGWLIGPSTIATAGHCVYDDINNVWASGVTVYPGRDGNKFPYGSVPAYRLFTVTGWTEGNREYDYGAIQLSEPVGNTTGYFGFRSTPASLNDIIVNLSGYPSDKPSGTQWQHSNRIVQSEDRQLFYPIDTFRGQSGSPVYEFNNPDCAGPCGLAIHAYGRYGGSSFNRGTRINSDVFDNLVTWINYPEPE